MQLPPPAVCPELNQLSPSLAAALAECPFRCAQERAAANKPYLRASTSLLLGQIFHAVIHRINARRFTWPDSDPCSPDHARAVVDQLWDKESTRVAAEADGGRVYVDPRHWPNYALRRARARKLLVPRLSGSRKPVGGVATVAPEKLLRAENDQIVGIPDLVVTTSEGLVLEEYKTGRIRDAQGAILERYRLQLHLYSFLLHQEYGEWPVRIRLVPIEGEPYEECSNPIETERYVKLVLNLLAQYQKTLNEARPDPHAQMRSLATPGPDACRHCPVRAWCEPYWEAGQHWQGNRFDLDGVISGHGTGQGLIRVSTSAGTVTVGGLQQAHPSLDVAALSGARLLDLVPTHHPGHLLYDSYSQVWWR